MCCTQLAENQHAKKSPKIHHLGTIAQLCRVVSSQLRHVSTIGKNLLNSSIVFTCPHNMPNFDPLMAEWFHCLGHPSKFQWVLCLGFVTAARSLTVGQPNLARCLAVSGAGTLYIHFLGLLPPDGILPCTKFNLHPSCILLYWQRYVRHSSSRRHPKFAAC